MKYGTSVSSKVAVNSLVGQVNCVRYGVPDLQNVRCPIEKVISNDEASNFLDRQIAGGLSAGVGVTWPGGGGGGGGTTTA